MTIFKKHKIPEALDRLLRKILPDSEIISGTQVRAACCAWLAAGGGYNGFTRMTGCDPLQYGDRRVVAHKAARIHGMMGPNAHAYCKALLIKYPHWGVDAKD